MCCKQGCCLLCLYVCLYCLCKIGDRAGYFSFLLGNRCYLDRYFLPSVIPFWQSRLLVTFCCLFFRGVSGVFLFFFEAFSISLSCISVDFVCNALYISCLVIFKLFEIQKFAIFPYFYQVFSIYSNYRMFLPCVYMCKITKMDIYSQYS